MARKATRGTAQLGVEIGADYRDRLDQYRERHGLTLRQAVETAILGLAKVKKSQQVTKARRGRPKNSENP
jgi:hypothetical protein